MARNSQNRRVATTGPGWKGDFGSRDHLVPGGVILDAAAFRTALNAVADVTVTANGIQPVGATALTVDALTGFIPSGTTLDFGGGKTATTTANAYAGATSIPVAPLTAQIADNDDAVFANPDLATTGGVFLPSGTAVGRTLAERDASAPFGPADAADDEIFLLAFDTDNLDLNPDGTLYRPGSVVKENYLPEVLAGTMISGVLDVIRERYLCTRGTD